MRDAIQDSFQTMATSSFHALRISKYACMTHRIHTIGSTTRQAAISNSKLRKANILQTVRYDGGQWTITDASLSPDNRFLAYSSIRSIVALAHTDPDNDSEPHYLDFADLGRPTPRGYRGYFGVRCVYQHLRLWLTHPDLVDKILWRWSRNCSRNGRQFCLCIRH